MPRRPLSYKINSLGIPALMRAEGITTRVVASSDSRNFTRELTTIGQGWFNGGAAILGDVWQPYEWAGVALRLSPDSLNTKPTGTYLTDPLVVSAISGGATGGQAIAIMPTVNPFGSPVGTTGSEGLPSVYADFDLDSASIPTPPVFVRGWKLDRTALGGLASNAVLVRAIYQVDASNGGSIIINGGRGSTVDTVDIASVTAGTVNFATGSVIGSSTAATMPASTTADLIVRVRLAASQASKVGRLGSLVVEKSSGTGLIVNHIGMGSTTSAHWGLESPVNTTGGMFTDAQLNAWASANGGVDVWLCCLGTNDIIAGTIGSTYYDNMQAYITRCLAASTAAGNSDAKVVLVTDCQGSYAQATTAAMETMQEANIALAEANPNVAHIDMWEATNRKVLDIADPNMLPDNTVHFSEYGVAHLHRTMWGLLMGFGDRARLASRSAISRSGR